MRLIDADKITFFNCLAKTGNSVCCHAEGIVSKSAIEMQPTVKAIPIEWLKNKSKDLADAYWNNVRNKLVLNMNELPLVIDEIVRIWEKENDNKHTL